MLYFYSEENLSLGGEVEVAGEEARHILLAHRKKKGEKVKLQGPDGKRFEAEILEIERNNLKLKPFQEIMVPLEPAVEITLFQAVVNEKALDFIFQKGTELGLNKIVLFNSANTATKLSVDNFKKKHERWQKILMEAAKQSERSKWPSLEFTLDIIGVLERVKGLDKIYLADISGKKLTVTNGNLKKVGIMVGPEGGFTNEEVNLFKSWPNVELMSLGPVLLRAETASLAATAILRNNL